MSSQSSFERDRDIARERYPEETERLETLRAGFDTDFPAALQLARDEDHLIRWLNGTYILSYEPSESPVNLLVRLDLDRQQITDLGIVGPINCSPLVEVRYERQSSAPQSEPAPGADRGREQRAQLPPGYFEEDSYWGCGEYYGDPPTIPPGAISISRATSRCSQKWKRETGAAR